MNIEQEEKNGFLIIRIKDDLKYDVNFEEVREIIETNLEQGVVDFAVSFTPKTRLSSISLGFILTFYTLIEEKMGRLCIVQPNDEDSGLLEMLSLTAVIGTYNSEEEIFEAQSPLD